MPEYYLVNPLIGGSMKTTFTGKNNLEAANKAYTAISENFNNSIPEFYFTLQEKTSQKSIVGGGKISDYKHYQVKETKKNNQVNYRLTEHKPEAQTKLMNKFRSEIKKVSKKTQSGGAKKHSYDDDDSDLLDDDSEDMYFPKMKSSTIYGSPISTWWYDPYVFRIKNYYTPTFIAPLTPYLYNPVYDPFVDIVWP
tara:strand:+ start:879 stop:1463 length:585 start_codon:yes stop_codon:yes gene_type:complete